LLYNIRKDLITLDEIITLYNLGNEVIIYEPLTMLLENSFNYFVVITLNLVILGIVCVWTVWVFFEESKTPHDHQLGNEMHALLKIRKY